MSKRSRRDCVKRIIETSNHRMSAEDARKILDDFEKTGKKSEKYGEDADVAINKLAEEYINASRRAAFVEKRNMMLKASVYAKTKRNLNDALSKGKLFDGFKAFLGGVQTDIEGGRLSMDKQQKQRIAKLQGTAIAHIQKNKLEYLMNDKTGESEKQVARYVFWLADGKKGDTPDVSADVKSYAGLMYDMQEMLRKELNLLGADIGKLEGFIAHQSHSMDKVRNAAYVLSAAAEKNNPIARGFHVFGEKLKSLGKYDREIHYTAWRDFILPRLDSVRTFGKLNNIQIEEFMRSAFDALESGTHIRADGTDGSVTFEFTGPANLAKKISQHRKFHFKGADAFVEYNSMFGNGDIIESFFRTLEHSGRNITLMENLGTNPRAMFDKLIRDFSVEARADSEQRLTKLQIKWLEAVYNNVDGSVYIPVSSPLAKVGSAFRVHNNLTMLGGVLVPAISDVPLKASELRYQGHNVFSATARALISTFKVFTPAQQKQFRAMQGIAHRGFLNSQSSRVSAIDDLQGFMGRMQATFFKLNFLTQWTEHQRGVFSDMMLADIGFKKDTAFHDLDAGFQKMLSHYRIGASHWEAIRLTATKLDDGNLYGDVSAVKDISNKKLAGIIAKYHADDPVMTVDKFRREVDTRFGTWHMDRVDHAVIEPGAGENAILNLGQQRGTVLGEAMPLGAQFKAFGVTFVRNVLGREIYARGHADYMGLIYVMTMATVYGYVSMSLNDLRKGRNPRPIMDDDGGINFSTLQAAMLQGGGLGIYGDFLFAEYSRHGHSLESTLAGPTISGKVSDFAVLYSKALQGDDVAASGLRFLINNTPGNNLFYLRGAIDYYFLLGIQEHLNPGYLRRMERRVKRENATDFWLAPTDSKQW